MNTSMATARTRVTLGRQWAPWGPPGPRESCRGTLVEFSQNPLEFSQTPPLFPGKGAFRTENVCF